MIQQVSIRNFKCLRDVTIDLEPFTVFVGANGSGKTSVLQAIDLVCRTFRNQPTQLEGEYRQHRSFGVEEEVDLTLVSSDFRFRYRTNEYPVPSVPAHNPAYSAGNGISGWTGNGNSACRNTLPFEWKPWQPMNGGKIPSSLWLKLEPKMLRTIQPGHDIRSMSDTGLGMHRALSSMLLERRSDFFKLEEDLKKIVPSVCQLQPTAEHEIRFDTKNGKGLTASQVSEGTLLTLGLLTAIHGVNKPGILLLDDLDRALHPKAQRELIELLRGVQKANPEIQIVATTHSPYMLDCMDPKEVRMTSLKDDGSTACDALTHHPKYHKWKDEFAPGEMWSFFGEKWVAEGEVMAK